MEITERIKILMKSIITGKGVNVQTIGTDKPQASDNTIMLYIVDEKHGIKDFRVTHALKMLLDRRTYGIAFGTTDKEGTKKGVVLAWGWEHPETFERTLKEMKEAGIKIKVIKEED